MSKKPTDFAFAISKYLASYLPGVKGVSHNTIMSYRDTLSLFLTYCSEVLHLMPERLTLKDISSQTVENFLAWLEESRHSSVSTRNQRLTALRAFFRYIQMVNPEHMLLSQQIIAIPSKKACERVMNYLSIDELMLLLSMPDTKSKQGRRNLVLLSLLYDSGARVQEIADTTFVDVRTESPATIRLVGKGNKVRIVPLSTDTATLLRAYMEDLLRTEHVPSSRPLFCNHIGQKMSRAGIAYILNRYVDMVKQTSASTINDVISPHCLRHSKAMHLLQSGVNIVYIRDLLGHASLRTTEKYARAESEQKHKALEAASPIKSVQKFPLWTENDNLMSWLQSFGKASN